VSAMTMTRAMVGLVFPRSILLMELASYPDLCASWLWDHCLSTRSSVITAPKAPPRVLVCRLSLLLIGRATPASSGIDPCSYLPYNPNNSQGN